MTSFDTIHDFTLLVIQDYKLNSLYNPEDMTDFNTLMDGFLIRSIELFTNCKQDLTFDPEERYFNSDLTLAEQIILSDIEVYTWLESKINDLRQMNLFLNDTDFKTYAQSQNLLAKVEAHNILREKFNQDMVNYGLKNIPWTQWSEGNFFGT